MRSGSYREGRMYVCTTDSPLSLSLSLGSLHPLALAPLWPVENDTFRNCAASLCEGTCRERAQSHA